MLQVCRYRHSISIAELTHITGRNIINWSKAKELGLSHDSVAKDNFVCTMCFSYMLMINGFIRNFCVPIAIQKPGPIVSIDGIQSMLGVCASPTQRCLYSRLIVLGCNGLQPTHLLSQFGLWKN
jgi:hypothetical protein